MEQVLVLRAGAWQVEALACDEIIKRWILLTIDDIWPPGNMLDALVHNSAIGGQDGNVVEAING